MAKVKSQKVTADWSEKLKRNYKIHGLTTANSAQCRDNGRFYETQEEAESRAIEYVQQSGEAMVIYKAIAIIAPETPPVTKFTLED